MAATAPSDQLRPQKNEKKKVCGAHCDPNDKEHPYRILMINQEQQYDFCTNFVKTSKYSLASFLPIFLMEEFHPKTMIANLYFLFISCMQVIPPISNTSGYPTTLMPLSFVVVVDAVFAVLEDLNRHKADDEANGRPTLVFDAGQNKFVEKKWNAVQVGDLVKILNREQIPADLCVVGVSEIDPANPTGMCYVETKSLDGETNLKVRQCPGIAVGIIKTDQDAAKLKGHVEMEHPNKVIEGFTGVLELNLNRQDMENGSSGTRAPLQPKNLFLRGCVLRNTPWIIGLVLNTGHDTKIIQSITKAPQKSSSLELKINHEIKWVTFFLAMVCLTGALGSVFWNVAWAHKMTYLGWENLTGAQNFGYFIAQFFYYLLLLSNFIPISLYVSMSTVKFIQSYFMQQDLQMYHEPSDTPAKVRTFALNEELGQITHIFSDKTGTLTENIMEFRKCSINGVSYGRGLTEIGKAALKELGKEIPKEEEEAEVKARANKGDHVAFYDDTFFRDLEKRAGFIEGQSKKIEDFFRVLAVCHSINSEKVPNSDQVVYSASSPDDEALVCGAKYFGWEFRDRQDGCALIRCKAKNNEIDKYEILEVMEFSSKRKRMSVILKDRNGKLLVFSKGADTVMQPRLKKGQEELWKKTSDHMLKFAIEGFRTLVIAQSHLDEKFYLNWQEKFTVASNDLDQINLQKSGEDNDIDRLTEEIEKNLELLGCTAIEDKLQDDVGGAIADLVQAGLSIWMLTGDKEETAINIALACKLILPIEQMERVIMNSPDPVELEREFDVWLAKPKPQARCLVIDGPCLLVIEGKLSDKLLRLTQTCKAVVGCRVSPDQKRQMVALIKYGIPGVRTLAIGDGANDVAMIQEAHVGVGISGQEGMQAVNSSDYAIAQFKFLRKLLLVHGRWNYRRMSKLVCYVFYKNILMALPMFWYGWANGFGGVKPYPETGIQLFNLMYTAFPIVLVGISDQDISAELAQKHPMLYFVGIHDTFFTDKIFWTWVLSATWEGCLFGIVPLFACGNVYQSYLEPGYVTLTTVIFVCNLKLIWNQHKWTWFHFWVWFLSTMVWFITSWGCTFIETGLQGVFVHGLREPRYWFCVALMAMIAIMRDVYWKGFNREFFPKPHHIVEEIEVFKLDSKGLMPTIKSIQVTGSQAAPPQIPRGSLAGYAFSTDDYSESVQRDVLRQKTKRGLRATSIGVEEVKSDLDETVSKSFKH